jgi:hypothetical protein
MRDSQIESPTLKDPLENGAPRHAAATERKPSVNRATAVLGGNVSVTVSCAGLSLDRFVEVLEETIRRAKKVRPWGIELPTFLRILKDEAKSRKGKADVGLSQK